MKVIIVLPASPLPFGDTAARWFYAMLKELLARNCRIVCYVVSEESPEKVSESVSAFRPHEVTGQITFRVHRPEPHPSVLIRKARSLWRPYGETYMAPGLQAALGADLAKGYDILHLEQLWTGWLGIGVKRSLLNIHHFEIIDWEDRTHLTAGEKKALIQMKRATRTILQGSQNLRLFSPRLEEKARQINPGANCWTLPFALDTDLYPVLPPVVEPVVGLFGSMHWYPSRSAAVRLITRIWPLIKQQIPAARLLIAGWNAKKYLSELVNSPDIELVENLPHPADFFSRASVMLYAPSKGSGMKIKVLESMAYGVPVVTTHEGVEGLSYSKGVECEVAETDSELATRAVELLLDSSRRERMRLSARHMIEEFNSPGAVVDGLMRIYAEIVARNSVAP